MRILRHVGRHIWHYTLGALALAGIAVPAAHIQRIDGPPAVWHSSPLPEPGAAHK